MIRETLDSLAPFFFQFYKESKRNKCDFYLDHYFNRGTSFMRLKVGGTPCHALTDADGRLGRASSHAGHSPPTCRAHRGLSLLASSLPHVVSPCLLLKALAVYKHLTSDAIPEGSWLWYLDADAIITNFSSDIHAHVRAAPSLHDLFEEYTQPVPEDPSLVVSAHSIKPWPIKVRSALRALRVRGRHGCFGRLLRSTVPVDCSSRLCPSTIRIHPGPPALRRPFLPLPSGKHSCMSCTRARGF